MKCFEKLEMKMMMQRPKAAQCESLSRLPWCKASADGDDVDNGTRDEDGDAETYGGTVGVSNAIAGDVGI
ncbi:hypothetical protein ILYODFUR_001172 [Ilyodon furcidens]|uniref:Uncharacterized protein n=1 Tax=Ilyodon furcidens TaxID=33524 RepID=A0ABV0SKE9_9TELE